MEDHPLKRSSLLADMPEIPRKKRSDQVSMPELESLSVDSSLDVVTRDECHSSDSTQKKTKTKGKRKPMPKGPILRLYAMPDVLRRKIRGMGGGRIILVIQKQLSYTDVSRVNSRLSIPRSQTIFDFLSKDEDVTLDGYVENSKQKAGINVLVIDPRLEEMKLSFKKWQMDKTCVYNVIQGWNRLVEENGLEVGDTIQLWSFRNKKRKTTQGPDLCFALVKLEEEGGVNNGDARADAASAESTQCWTFSTLLSYET